jgi:hypothetical protein
MTYLKFTLNDTSDAESLVIARSNHIAIHLLEVYYSSTQLEYTRDYNSLVSVLMDSQAFFYRELKNGTVLKDVTTTRSSDINLKETSRTYCIPSVSVVIGSMAEKMFAVGSLTLDNLNVSITLADHLDLMVQVPTTPWTVS